MTHKPSVSSWPFSSASPRQGDLPLDMASADFTHYPRNYSLELITEHVILSGSPFRGPYEYGVEVWLPRPAYGIVNLASWERIYCLIRVLSSLAWQLLSLAVYSEWPNCAEGVVYPGEGKYFVHTGILMRLALSFVRLLLANEKHAVGNLKPPKERQDVDTGDKIERPVLTQRPSSISCG